MMELDFCQIKDPLWRGSKVNFNSSFRLRQSAVSSHRPPFYRLILALKTTLTQVHQPANAGPLSKEPKPQLLSCIQ